MAPSYPDEVDVFTVPHSRMKQLVHKYLDMVSSTNFRDVGRMTDVLEKLCHTFHEFKSHEQIENRLIMRRLKEKLMALSITDAAVCNCHSDNRLTEMLSLVLEGYRWAQRSEHERVKYGLRLRRALEDFTQVFLPHMKEEEEVFQPMLMEYFTYEELKELKEKVIQKHMEQAEETEKADVPVPEAAGKAEELEMMSETQSLPDEVMLSIFAYLSPRDLSRCAQVSSRWNHLALDPALWPTLHPVQWAAGDWSFHPHLKDEEDEEESGGEDVGGFFYVDDEDADIDESSDSEGSEDGADASLQQVLREVRIISGLVRHVLKRVGAGVHECNLAHSRGLSSSLVHKILKLCPNLETLNLAHTKITDAAFKEYGIKGGLGRLEHLDLTGCENITDTTLYSLTGSGYSIPSDNTSSCPGTFTDTKTLLLGVHHDGVQSFPMRRLISLSQPEDCENSHSSVLMVDPCLSETENLIANDPSFTDLAIELCDLGCLGVEQNIGNDGPEDSEQQMGTERSCCQTRDIFCGGGDKNKAAKCKKKQSCAKGGSNVRTKCVPKTGCCGGEGVELKCDNGQVQVSPSTLPHALHQLRFLSLNGCFRIQDDGLRVLSDGGGLPVLQHLDLSGCLNLTGTGVETLVNTCPALDHAHLYYCDNLDPDPFPTTASGCRNLQCSSRICCRSGE